MPTKARRCKKAHSGIATRLRHAKKTNLDRVHEDIVKRLWKAIDGEYTLRGIAEATGFHHESVRRWFQGINVVALPFVVPLCKATGVNIEWLITGRGPSELHAEHSRHPSQTRAGGCSTRNEQS